jgi:hypothetical protein
VAYSFETCSTHAARAGRSGREHQDGAISLNISLNTVALTRAARNSIVLLTVAATFSNEPEVLALLSYINFSIEASRVRTY